MNKQEFQQNIKDMKPTNYINSITIYDAYNEGFEEAKQNVLLVSNSLAELEKPVVPQFVAEWIEIHKEPFSDSSAIDMYGNLTLDNSGGYYHEVWLWVIDHHYDFIKAWHDGYEIEKEILYTVEIPNPNLNVHAILQKTGAGIVLVTVGNARWKGWESSKLTEAEIKQDFDFLWQFAKEV